MSKAFYNTTLMNNNKSGLNTLLFVLLLLLPKNLISRFLGVLANYKFHPFFLINFIRFYSYVYKIDLRKYSDKGICFLTFNDFFARKIDLQERIIDENPSSVISPVDGTILWHGEIKHNQLYQAKNILYFLEELVGEENAKIFQDGYYITIYLSPADYHRIHSPVSGAICGWRYFSGNLWPVNSFAVQTIGKLFCINERFLTLFKYSDSSNILGLLKVGATVVGKIKTNYTNISSNSNIKNSFSYNFEKEITVEKGKEMARFELGSCVILLFQKNQFNPIDIKVNEKVKMGEPLGYSVFMNDK